MANPTVTYTFSNGTAADASQVNTNFTDLINSLTDATKSLSVDALTAAGVATFNGNVTLGNASGDTVTVNGTSTFAETVVLTDGITGIGDGSAADAGEVGEYSSASSTAVQSNGGSANSYEDATSLTLSLTAGSWLVGYHVSIGKNGGLASTVMTTGSNAAVAETLRTTSTVSVTSASTVINISSTTTYKVRWRQNGTGADTFRINTATGAFTDPDDSSIIWAVRIR